MRMFETLGRVMDPSQTLKIQCSVCGRRAEWSYKVALAALGPEMTPYDARRRLRCLSCETVGRLELWI